MGVDYSANFGVGYKITTTKYDEDNDLHILDTLEEVIGSSKYSYFETGDESYTGEDNEYYVVLDDFHPINTLEDRLLELKEHLLGEGLIGVDAEYDLVGGLLIW